jgi:hypothetical protein
MTENYLNYLKAINSSKLSFTQFISWDRYKQGESVAGLLRASIRGFEDFENIFRFRPHIMLRDSLTQIPLILDTPEHVDSGNMKFKIGRRSSVASTNFFQNVI